IIAQLVEHLPSMCEALGLILSPHKNKIKVLYSSTIKIFLKKFIDMTHQRSSVKFCICGIMLAFKTFEFWNISDFQMSNVQPLQVASNREPVYSNLPRAPGLRQKYVPPRRD
ncbi:hypothetical protein H1C71_007052, partial [Ictidomys tridecemlineatus]